MLPSESFLQPVSTSDPLRDELRSSCLLLSQLSLCSFVIVGFPSLSVVRIFLFNNSLLLFLFSMEPRRHCVVEQKYNNRLANLILKQLDINHTDQQPQPYSRFTKYCSTYSTVVAAGQCRLHGLHLVDLQLV